MRPKDAHSYRRDPEAFAVAEFKAEGAFLHAADVASEALERRLTAADPSVKLFALSRDELGQLSLQFKRAVAIGKEYHIDAAETAA